MTIREITDKILEYHPKFDEDYDGCDGFKSGNPDDAQALCLHLYQQ